MIEKNSCAPGSSASKTLSLEDVGKIVRLLAEVAVLPDRVAEKRRSLLAGLGELIGADAWIWGVSGHADSGRQPEYTCIVNEGFTEREFAKVLEANEHPDMRELYAPLFAELGARPHHLTRRREQIIPDSVYEASEVAGVWREAGVWPVILSFYPLDRGGASAVALYRRHDGSAFGARDSRIAHTILSEVSWLHIEVADLGVPSHRLAPRLRQTLGLLIQGVSRKEIASHLDLSINTVSGYCKELYQTFQVHSHAELVRRFSHGDGGDRCAATTARGSKQCSSGREFFLSTVTIGLVFSPMVALYDFMVDPPQLVRIDPWFPHGWKSVAVTFAGFALGLFLVSLLPVGLLFLAGLRNVYSPLAVWTALLGVSVVLVHARRVGIDHSSRETDIRREAADGGAGGRKVL